MSSSSETNLVDSSGFRDPELDKPKKTFTDEKPIFASVQLKSSTFRDPELDKPKKTFDEDKPAFSVQLKGSGGGGFRDPELDKHQHRKPSSEDLKPLIQLKNFRDPELDKPKKTYEESKPAFASVPLRSSTFRDPELEKSKRASSAPTDAPVFAQVQLKSGGSEARSPSASRKSYAASDADSRKSFHEEKPAFSVALKKTEVVPADLQKSPTLENNETPEAIAFAVKLKSVNSDFKDPEVTKKTEHPLEKKTSFYETVVALKKTRNAPADLRGDSPNIHKSPTSDEKEEKKDDAVPVFVGVKLRSISDKLKAAKLEESNAAPAPVYELPRKTFANPDTAGLPESEADPEAGKPVFASVGLKRAEAIKTETDASEGAVSSPQEKKMSFYDVAVTLRKAESTNQGEPVPSRSPPPSAAEPPLPEFVGFKLKKLGEQAKERNENQEQRKGLSFTRRMNSVDNFKYLDEPPAPSVASPPNERKSLTKSKSFTKRSTEADWEAKMLAVNNQ